MQNHKTSRRWHRKNLSGLGFGDDFLDITPEALATEEKIDKLKKLKLKTSVWRTLIREWKNKTQTGRKYLQNT